MELFDIIENLKKSGLRITPARKQIIKFFWDSQSPLAADDVLVHIKVNKTTVYREIETLLSHKYLTQIDFADSKKRYELSARGHHHHLVCMQCKSITELDIADNFSKEEKRIQKQEKFTVLKHTLEFFGLCKTCTA